MFIDEVTIEVHAGNGGDGCTAFRREKFVPMGGPYGGNGGRGSNIVFKVDEGLHTLLDLRYNRIIKGKKGENGTGKNCDGKNSEDVIIKVPQGTVITDTDTNLIVADLKNKDDQVIVAYGGRGGRGNTAFKTQSNPAPNFSENGEPGEVKYLKVELKMLADVGLVGLPSVGKSTLISMVSKAKPKIAAYHFTTLTPNLGVCKDKKGRSFVMADLPGLIEGASEGEGLGDRFLRHIERTKVIAHVIDMSGYEGRDPYDDYQVINKELESFSEKLIQKPQIIIANKMDLDSAKENLANFKKKVKEPIYEISAMNNEGLEDVLVALGDLLETIEDKPLFEEDQFEGHVLYKFKKEEPYTITREDNGTWVLSGDELEKLFRMTKFTTDEGILRFTRRLRKMGVDDKLESLGAQEGDKVRILDFEFEYRN
ncbi:MAG: GTPase ObgE [Tenericutes bacterium]|nr:GTPase ObgE [Mycoplasmatota bacterium]